MVFSNLLLFILRVILWCLCGWVFAAADGLTDFFGCSVLGLLIWYPGRQKWGPEDSALAFPLPLLVTWWGLRQGLSLMEGQGWVLIAAWVLFLGITWRKTFGDETGGGTSLLDSWTVWACGLCLVPWQAGSLAQGMSFGWQAGLLDLVLAERILARLVLGWRTSRWLPLLIGGFILFYQQSLTGWFVRPAYAWLHLQYQVSLVLIALFFWVSPGWKTKMTVIGWSAVPVVLAALLVRLQSGDLLFADRFAFATLHPNLLASAFLLSFLALSAGSDPASPHRGLRLAGMALLAFGVIATQSRLQISMLVLAVLYTCGLLRPSKFRAVALISTVLVALYAAGLWFQILPDRFDFRNIPSERWFIWQAGAYRVLNAPFGEGFLGFGLQAQPLALMNQDKVWDWYYPHTHNLYLETFLALGIPMGFAAIVFLLVLMFRRRESEDGLMLLVSQLLMGLADFVWFTPFHLALFIGAILGNEAVPSADSPSPVLRPAPRILFTVAVVCFLAAAVPQCMSERAAALQQAGWQKLGEGQADDAAALMRQAGDLDQRRVEYPLYLAMIEWQRGEAGLDGASVALRRLQRLMPDWDIPWVAQALHQVILGNDQSANRIFEGLLNTPHPDLSGWRSAWVALTESGETRVLNAGRAMARSSLMGELFLGLEPVLEPQFTEKALKMAIGEPLPRVWKVTALLFGLDELGPPLKWVYELPRFFPNLAGHRNDNLLAVCREIGRRANLGKAALELPEPETRGLVAARIGALAAFSEGDFPRTRACLGDWRRWFPSGNEGFAPIEADRLEALVLEKEGNLQRATEMLSRVVAQAPEWMDARVDLCRLAEKTGGVAVGPEFVRQSLLILAQSWKQPFKLSWRSYEARPTGDNWTVLLSRAVIQQWLNRHAPSFVPFATEKRAWKEFWESRLSAQ